MNDEELLSKTKQKKICHDTQALGISLIDLQKKQWDKLPISPELRAALEEALRIKHRGAMKRHHQYIGRLMRDEDAEAIEEKLSEFRGDSPKRQAQLKRIEQWRERLLSDDENAQTELFQQYPACEAQPVRQWIRNAKKQSPENPIGTKASKELFQYLKQQDDAINFPEN